MQDHASLAPHPAILQTGHAGIDDDHDELMALCAAFLTLADSELPQAFVQLHARFAGHFADEDALMASQDFSSRECHVDEHAAVLQSFEQVQALLQAGRLQPARNMAAHLVNWLPEHIDALDRQLAKFLFFRQTGGAPVLLHRR